MNSSRLHSILVAFRNMFHTMGLIKSHYPERPPAPSRSRGARRLPARPGQPRRRWALPPLSGGPAAWPGPAVPRRPAPRSGRHSRKDRWAARGRAKRGGLGPAGLPGRGVGRPAGRGRVLGLTRRSRPRARAALHVLRSRARREAGGRRREAGLGGAAAVHLRRGLAGRGASEARGGGGGMGRGWGLVLGLLGAAWLCGSGRGADTRETPETPEPPGSAAQRCFCQVSGGLRGGLRQVRGWRSRGARRGTRLSNFGPGLDLVPGPASPSSGPGGLSGCSRISCRGAAAPCGPL